MSENSDKNYQSELTDQTFINNIDLGGILNLATEDTLNIRYSCNYEIHESVWKLQDDSMLDQTK